ncbi:MAG: SMI1/KNR4 family protein [Byssovorax sp.]
MLDSYLTRFRAAVDALAAEPAVKIVRFSPGAPCAAKQIAAWEKARGLRLDPALRAFYQQCDGLMLRWIREDDEDQRAALARTPAAGMSWDYLIGDYSQDQGRALIRPLEELTPEGFWSEGEDPDDDQDETEIDGYSIITADLRRRALSFDLFSYSTFAVLLPRPDKPWIVLHGSDHGVCFDDDPPLDVETYLELVLACVGHLRARYATLRGHRAPHLPQGSLVHAPASYWATHPFSKARLLGNGGESDEEEDEDS